MKKNNFKKIIATALAGLMVFGAAPAASFAGIKLPELNFASIKASATTVDDLTYETANGEITITGYNESLSGDLVIPSEIDGVPVTAIKNYAFSNSNLKSVVIPDSIVNVGSGVFYKCKSLESATIGKGVKSLSYLSSMGFFALCEKLESVTFAKDSSLETIGTSAFQSCSLLQTITVPATVSTIDASAFLNCRNLESVVFEERTPDQKLTIGNSAFSKCESLKTINIEDSNVNSIGNYASSYSGLKSIIIPDSVIDIGSGVFYSCKSLESATIGKGVKSLSLLASMGFFALCEKLESVTFAKDSSLETIGTSAFQSCSLLQTINVPATVSTIDNQAFMRCSNLESVVFEERTPDRKLTIGDSAFSRCESLKAINIEDSNVNSIGNYAFSYSGLKSIIIPDSVIDIGSGVFYSCKSLESATIGKGVKSLSMLASMGFFALCEKLKTVVFTEGSSVTAFGKGAFSKCSSLEYFDYYGTEENWNSIDKADSSLPTPIRIENKGNFIRIFFKESVSPATYTLTYNANGGNGAPANQTGNGNITLSNTKPTRDGYTFLGWAATSGATSAQYQPGASYYLSASTTLYAVWQNNSSQAAYVTIKANPGTKTIDYGQVLRLEAQAPDGYEIRWFIGSKDTGKTGATFEYDSKSGNADIRAVLYKGGKQVTTDDGNEISAAETVKVRSGFLQRLIAFFKYTLFRMNKVVNN